MGHEGRAIMNGISFPVTRSEWIKILFDSADIAVNEIIFYGNES